MLNYLALSGKLSSDPEMKYCGDNQDQPAASFTLAFRTGNNRTGQIRVTCFNSLAELAGRYLHRGANVAVSGILDQQEEEVGEGEQKSGLRLIARSLEIVGIDCYGNTAVTPLRPWLSGHPLSGDKSADDHQKGSD
jgi:single-strand DNA-binding protein